MKESRLGILRSRGRMERLLDVATGHPLEVLAAGIVLLLFSAYKLNHSR